MQPQILDLYCQLFKVNGHIIAFGGADSGNSDEENPDPTHFQDVICYKKTQNGKPSRFQILPTTGDVPMARSGHSVVVYGKYMFLFGGSVFSHNDEDAAAFNDLYIFCTGSFHSISTHYVNVVYLIILLYRDIQVGICW